MAATTESADVGTAELCVLLGVCRKTVFLWRALGRIGPRPVTGPGQHPKWDRLEVRAWLANRDPKGRRHDEASWAAVWPTLRRRYEGSAA